MHRSKIYNEIISSVLHPGSEINKAIEGLELYLQILQAFLYHAFHDDYLGNYQLVFPSSIKKHILKELEQLSDSPNQTLTAPYQTVMPIVFDISRRSEWLKQLLAVHFNKTKTNYDYQLLSKIKSEVTNLLDLMVSDHTLGMENSLHDPFNDNSQVANEFGTETSENRKVSRKLLSINDDIEKSNGHEDVHQIQMVQASSAARSYDNSFLIAAYYVVSRQLHALPQLVKDISQQYLAILPELKQETSNLQSGFSDTVALTAYETPQQGAWFDFAAWDNAPEMDIKTGQPIFTYRAYLNNEEVGHAKFYGHPLLCRSEDYARHNVLELKGVFTKINLDLAVASTEDVCSVLPLSLWEQMAEQAIQSGLLGSLRGTSGLVDYTMQKAGHSSTTAWLASKAVFYGGFFTMSFARQYNQQSGLSPDEEGWENTTTSLYQALFDTGWMAATEIGLSVGQKFFAFLGTKAKEQQWHTTAKVCQTASHWIPYVIYAHRVINQGTVETSVSIASGTMAQTVVETTGKPLVNRFFGGEPEKLVSMDEVPRGEKNVRFEH